MENKEKAKEVVSQFIRHLYVSGSQQEQVVDLIAQAFREAEARGMERAAKISEGIAPRVSERPEYHPEGPGKMRHPVADAIRAACSGTERQS